VCTACLPAFTLVGSSCLSCPISNCQTCSAEGQCSICSGQMSPSTDRSQCVVCELDNCFSCLGDQQCGLCMTNYAPVEGQCLLCGVDHCSECDNSLGTLTCLDCQPGYLLDPSSSLCVANCSVANCLYCVQEEVCSECEANFTLVNNTCLPNCGVDFCVACTGETACEECLTNYALLSSNCVLLCDIPNCELCAIDGLGICESCATGLTPSTDGTECLTCTVANCVSCSSSNVCGECQGDLQFQNGACLSCNVDNCLSCSADNVCGLCSEGYSLATQLGATDPTCVACLNPCSSCYPDGTCLSCLPPYSQLALSQGQDCFLCADPRCSSCSDPNAGSCTLCAAGYSLANGTCQQLCSSGCAACTNVTTCTSCVVEFVYLSGASCLSCPNSPACTSCLASSPAACASCNTGYFLSSGTCLPCPAYCRTCSSTSWCTALANPLGYTLVATSSASNAPAACDPGCSSCSPAAPTTCTKCLSGFYLTASSYCRPCTPSSQCSSCSRSNPSLCLSCYPGAFLSSSSTPTCTACSFPCAACLAPNSTLCTACVQGYVLVSSSQTCQPSSSVVQNFNAKPVDNCANQVLNANNTVSCSLCVQGYALTEVGCAPCAVGCQICSATLLTNCIQCAPGYQLGQDNVCMAALGCPSNCQSCTSVGCLQCAPGYLLTQNFQCQLPCQPPCASCQPNQPLSCLSCLLGYSMLNGRCRADTSCNTLGNCQVCPFGTSLLNNNTLNSLSQSCANCTPASNCARCLTANTSQCTSCLAGSFLNSYLCAPCASSCKTCLSLTQCTQCASGYIPYQSGSLSGNLARGILNCVACSSPCASCQGDPASCTSCTSGFSLQGTVCLSQFNYAVQCVFGVTLATFQNNYLSFLNSAASAAGVSVRNIAVQSITSGSVVVSLQVSSFTAPGSTQSVQAQNNLNQLLNNGSIAGMLVTSFSLATVGGSNSNGSSSGPGLPQTTIIILAVVIPLGVVRTHSFI
jgi:hypothetical protein